MIPPRWNNLLGQLGARFHLTNTIHASKRITLCAIAAIGAGVVLTDLAQTLLLKPDTTRSLLQASLLILLIVSGWLLWRRRERQGLALLLLFVSVCVYLVASMTYETLQSSLLVRQGQLFYTFAPWVLWVTVLEIGCFYAFPAGTALRLALAFSAFALAGILFVLNQHWQFEFNILHDLFLLCFANGLAIFFAFQLANTHERSSQTDFLTGLPNRMSGYRVLQFEIERAARYDKNFAVILFDLDHFKKINDAHGHPAGDAVLRDFAEFIKQHIRRTDMFARWGGEEFLLIMPETDLASGRLKANHLRQQIKNRAFSRGVRITSSFGVTAFYPRDTTDTLLERADSALYRAKANGRNCVETE